MELRSPEVKADLVARLQRIEGQVRGVEKMVLEDRECGAILQQMTAIRSAVHNASLVLAQAVYVFMVSWNGLGGTTGLFLTEYTSQLTTLYPYALALAVLSTMANWVVLRPRPRQRLRPADGARRLAGAVHRACRSVPIPLNTAARYKSAAGAAQRM